MGIHVESKSLRRYVHYVMYFALGLAVCALCEARGWRPWIGILIGCGIGVVDEGIKVRLPTREFEVTDLMRDFVGVGVAVLVGMICRKAKAGKGYTEDRHNE